MYQHTMQLRILRSAQLYGAIAVVLICLALVSRLFAIAILAIAPVLFAALRVRVSLVATDQEITERGVPGTTLSWDNVATVSFRWLTVDGPRSLRFAQFLVVDRNGKRIFLPRFGLRRQDRTEFFAYVSDRLTQNRSVIFDAMAAKSIGPPESPTAT